MANRAIALARDTGSELAIRGGGGNFGVATRLQRRLHEVGRIVGGMLFLPATPEVLAAFIAEAEAAPEELSTIVNVMRAPRCRSSPRSTTAGSSSWPCSSAPVPPKPASAPSRVPRLTTPLADMVRLMTYPEMYPPRDETSPRTRPRSPTAGAASWATSPQCTRTPRSGRRTRPGRPASPAS